jgi:hypothetical protein
VGITVGANNRTQHLQAVVQPAGEAAKITLQPSGPNLSMTKVKRSDGGFTFDLVGAGRSNAKGDMSILAFHKGSELAWLYPVSVVVPGAIGAPHPQVDKEHGAVVGENRALNNETSPVWAETFLPGDVKLVTVYLHWLSVPVVDQFGEGIGGLYAGAKVEEKIRGAWYNVNQTLKNDSTYRDPVGAIQEKEDIFFGGDKFTDANGNGKWDPGEVLTADYDNDGEYDPPDPEVEGWPTAPKRPLAPGISIHKIPVKVDGFPLDPSVANRTVTAIPGVPPAADIITVVWP